MSKHFIGIIRFDTIIDSTLLHQIFHDLIKRGIDVEVKIDQTSEGNVVPKDVNIRFDLTKEVDGK